MTSCTTPGCSVEAGWMVFLVAAITPLLSCVMLSIAVSVVPSATGSSTGSCTIFTESAAMPESPRFPSESSTGRFPSVAPSTLSIFPASSSSTSATASSMASSTAAPVTGLVG